MSGKYEPLGKERYQIEQTSYGERIRIKARRQLLPLLFLPLWLAGWTAGGIAAISQLIRHFEPFLVFWLCGWAFGWVFAAGTIMWMLAGVETLSVVGADLEIAHNALGLSRWWPYQGKMIRHLGVASQPAWPYKFYWQIPFFSNTRQGTVRFDYGARTYFVVAGLDESEGRNIVEWLAKRLPAGAISKP